MCGIAGLYGFKNERLLKQFSKELLHRGPDGEGFYISNMVGLLNRRLAIIDRKGGSQPIYNEDKSIVVVYNGEIYNFKELRKQLQESGHKFTTDSDTEVIVHGYEEWNEKCFDKFNGMFSIALYDIKNETLLLVRDQFGIKPIYYSVLNSKSNDQLPKVIFSSEIKPLLNSNLLIVEANERMIYRYLALRVHDGDNQTFFNNIFKVMPGELIRISPAGIETSIYSPLRKNLEELSKRSSDKSIKANTVAEFKALLESAISRRLVSEVPLGIALSGGIDSTSITTIVNKLYKNNDENSASLGDSINTFSAVFPKSVNDEEDLIGIALKQLPELTSHKIYPFSTGLINDLTDFVRTQEEPTISTGAYAEYKIMQESSKHVTVLLEGQGADELMAGYPGYGLVYIRELLSKGSLPKALQIAWSLRNSLSAYLIKNLKYKLSLVNKTSAISILSTEVRSKFKGEKVNHKSSNLKQLLLQDVFDYSLQALLRYADRNSMRFSIEARVPFLDTKLVKYIFSLPNSAFISSNGMKSVLRQSMDKMLPKPILSKKQKIGFSIPEEEWLREAKKPVMEILNSSKFLRRSYINHKEVKAMFAKFFNGKNEDGLLIWRLLNLELWMREFIDGAKGKNNE